MNQIALGDICSFLSGFAWSAAQFKAEPPGIPIIRIQNVDAVQNRDFVYWNSSYDQRFIIDRGDLLLTLSGSFRVVEWAGPKALLNQRIVKLTPSDSVDRSWLLHILRAKLLEIENLGRHALVNNVSMADLKKLLIPLPPIEEQKRIADILDKAESLRAKRREALALINSLTQSIFLEMFGDPVSNDRNWNFQKVSDFVDGFETGKSLSADDQNDLASPYRVLKISAVTSLEYKPAESKALPPNYIPPKSHFVKAGDLLFSRANTSELIGATAFVFNTPDNMLLPDKLWRFVWHETPKADPLFVWHLFRQPKFREEVSRRSTGSSGSMKNISQDKVLSIEVGLPDLELQLQFSKKIQGLQKSLDAFKKSDYHLSNLFISLQNHCFSGNL